jgi:hypothetical protein
MTGIKITRKPVRMSANMTPSQVKRKRITIQNKMNTLNEQMAELKTMCQHPNVDKKYRANTGNYDPSADSYWIDWNCQDCGKRWMTDQ